MDGLPTVTLDPYLLAVPLSADRNELETYVAHLVAWSRLSPARWLSLSISQRTLEALALDESLPLVHVLTTRFREEGLVHLDARAVAVLVTQLLQKRPFVEELLGIDDVLVEMHDVDPDPPRPPASARVDAELTRCLILIGFVASLRRVNNQSHTIATRQSACPDGYVTVNGRLSYAETNQEYELGDLIFPIDFSQRVFLVDGLLPFVLSLDASALIRPGVTAEQFNAALRISNIQRAHGLGETLDWETAGNFRLGPELLIELEALGFATSIDKAGRLLRACTEACLRQSMEAVHAIREGAGANTPQLRRGADRAWRRDIDREFHLHYWGLGADTLLVEFACVVTHNDFHIRS